MSRQLKQLWCLTLWALLMGLPLFTHAAEAPGALTFIVKDENTDRPLSKVQITIKQRETSATQTLETDEQGRILVEQLEPGLYSVDVASLGESLGFAVRAFSQTNEQLMAQLQRIEEALDKSMTRSDEQLAYYVAQAREIIDLSIGSQKDVLDALQRRTDLVSEGAI